MIDIEKALPSLPSLRKRHVETEIVSLIAERTGLDAGSALQLYYRSKLSRQIADGAHGIQYLDAAYLFEDLLENEPELFASETPTRDTDNSNCPTR